MKILYIADGRSPTALNWIDYFVRDGHEVHLVSTFHCQEIPGLASMLVIPVALSGFYGDRAAGRSSRMSFLRKLLPVEIRTLVRQMAAPFSFPHVAGTLRGVIEQIKPDLIHAMRIPYEGMIAADALENITKAEDGRAKFPLLVSVWGNDFTLHARSTRAMMRYTRKTLGAASALHTDCQRDQRLAIELGFEASKLKITLPGGGGVRLDRFYPPDDPGEGAVRDALAPVTMINPRGFRAYVRNDTFFEALPAVIEKYPEAHFICTGMRDEPQAIHLAAEYCVTQKVELLPSQTPKQMAELFRKAMISLSITTHDGTPNTLLEAMACGCFPIAGDLESIREWITPGVNGFLVDPGNAQALASAILGALAKPELRKHAKKMNLELVKERADYKKCMKAAEKFYEAIVSGAK